MFLKYKDYILDLQKNGLISVSDSRFPENPIYAASDIAEAKRFVTAYRAGRSWAIEAVSFAITKDY